MHFSDFPFLRYLPFFLAGMLSSKWIPPSSLIPLAIGIGVLWIGYAVAAPKANRESTFNLSLLAYLLLFATGLLLALHHESEVKRQGLTKIDRQIQGYLGRVQDYDLQKPNSWENQVLVSHIFQNGKWEKVSFATLIYHSLGDSLKPGNSVFIQGAPEEIPAPNGPAQFDYRSWLLKNGVNRRQFVNNKIQVIGIDEEPSIRFFVKKTRQNLGLAIEASFENIKTQEIAKALLLGEKRSLDAETRSAYGQAGVMHILAVSGLHVGIVYALFLFLGNTLKLKGKIRKGFFIAVVFFLWFYAALTGFSPSVIRASCMFSLLIFGQIQNRKPPIFNILAFSAMLMMAVNPDVIFDVGFQLSYLAVGGIVLLQPLILSFWLPPNRVLEYLWQLMAVSIAAQLATFPLSVFYFHYFPTYFLLGNLLILPLAFLIMQLGVPWLVLMKAPFLGVALAWCLNLLIGWQNWIIEQLTLLPGGKLERLTISPQFMFLIWIILLLWVAWDSLPKRRLIRAGIYSSAFLLCWYFLVNGLKPKEELLIYPDSKGFLVDFHQNQSLKSFNDGFREEQVSFVADPYRLVKGIGIMPEELKSLQNDAGHLYFPETGLRVVRDSLGTQIIPGQSQKVSIWENGGWQPLAWDKKVTLGSNTLRILP